MWSALAFLHRTGRTRPTYAPRATDTLQHIFHDHFDAFSDAYDSLYAHDYGKFRLDRISRVVDRFESCGDYTKGAVTG